MLFVCSCFISFCFCLLVVVFCYFFLGGGGGGVWFCFFQLEIICFAVNYCRSGVILPEVHTPIKKETHKLPKKCIASMNDTSFCAFRSCIHEFRDHISSKKTMLPTSELSISSPVS